MRFPDLFRLAAGALTAHRVRSALTITAGSIGVAAVLLLVTLGDGAKEYVRGEFQDLGSNLVIVIPGKVETTGGPPIFGGTTRDLTIEDAIAVGRRARGVTRAAPIALGSAPVEYDGRGRTVTVVGTTAAYLALRDLRVEHGRFPAIPDLRRGPLEAVIGQTVVRELFDGVNPLGKVLRVGAWRFRVVGVLESKGESLGMDIDDIVLVPVAVGMKLFNRTGLFRILAQASSFESLEIAKGSVRRVLVERHDGEEDFTVMSEDAVAETFGEILDTLTWALGGIAAISLLVAGIGVMNVMWVSVSERTGEVGLFKAIGAGGEQILGIFLAEAALLAAAGGAAGVALGWLGATVMRGWLPALGWNIPFWSVAAAVGVSAGTGLLFGVLPARRAAAVPAVDALAGRAGT